MRAMLDLETTFALARKHPPKRKSIANAKRKLARLQARGARQRRIDRARNKLARVERAEEQRKAKT